LASETWITNGVLVTGGSLPEIVPDGVVKIAGRSIEWVGPRADAGAISGDVIDAGGALIMPGFVNAHMHYYSTFACGMALKDDPPVDFMQILERLWWRLDRALTLPDVRYSALIPLVRGLRAGVTTVIDHHSSPNAVRGSLSEIASAARQVGVRTCLCYEVSNRNGQQAARDGIEENAAFIESCRNGDGLASALFGLHASMTLDDALLAACVDCGRELGAGFHIHLSEAHFDPDDSLARCGKRVVHRLVDAGVLGDKSIAAHCIHIDEEELALLADSQACVVHNPQSNMNNAVGRADVLGMLERGITVGLGTDGMSASVLDDARLMYLLHRHGTRDPRVAFVEAGQMLLDHNAAIASRYFDQPVGRLAPGYKADIILVEYDSATPMSAAGDVNNASADVQSKRRAQPVLQDSTTPHVAYRSDNFIGHLLFGLSSARVTLAMVDGQVRMRDGKVLGVDESEIAREARRLAADVWRRF